jgi:uncharacterized membrane protein YfcA
MRWLTAYASVGLLSQQILTYFLAALPIMGAGLYLGERIHTGLSHTAFVRIISLLLLASGVMLLLKK